MERRKTTGNEAELNVLVVDGQGGMVGKQMVEAVRKMIPDAAITAVGTTRWLPQACSKQVRTAALPAKIPL